MTEQFDLTQHALDALPSRYNRDNFVQSFAKAVGSAGQILEDAVHDLILNSRIPNATGEYLDNWGGVVGEYRGGLDDDEYRKIILGKIASNRSYGRPDGVAGSIKNLFEPDDWYVNRYQPAVARVVIYDTTSYTESFKSRAFDLLESSFPTGVTVFITMSDRDGDTLRFDEPSPNSLDNGHFAKTDKRT